MVEGIENLAPRVIRTIQTEDLLQKNDTIVIAVSGGADSICLLHILAGLKKKLHINLHIAHLNHGLRGHKAQEDADYVAGLARRLDIPVTIEARDVAAYHRQKRCSPEEAAREVRYQFLADVSKSTGAGAVAVGHTRDDHIETILLHLLRGTGTAGLRGLRFRSIIHTGKENSTVTLVRPLLDISRRETVEYCSAHGLNPRFDESNLSPAFLRNRVRHELIPLLEQYNPSIDTALLRLSNIADADFSYIEEQAANAWKDIVAEKPGILYIDRKKIKTLPYALRRQLFRMALLQLAGNLRDFETDHVEAMLSFLSKPGGKQLDLPHGIKLFSQYDNLILSTDEQPPCPFPLLEKEVPIAIPGETTLPGWVVKAHISERASCNENAFSAYFDLDKAGTALSIRPRKRGDRFQPLGMAETKKLQDFMVDARIPQSWRNTIPVLTSPAHILWVVGWRIDERAKVTDSTQNVLHITFEKSG